MWGRMEARGVAGPVRWYRRNNGACRGGCKERTQSAQEEAWQGLEGCAGQQRVRWAEKGGPGGAPSEAEGWGPLEGLLRPDSALWNCFWLLHSHVSQGPPGGGVSHLGEGDPYPAGEPQLWIPLTSQPFY